MACSSQGSGLELTVVGFISPRMMAKGFRV